MSGACANRRLSEIAWIDDLPAHWDVRPLLAVAHERTEPNEGMKENNLLSLSYGRIVRKDITTDCCRNRLRPTRLSSRATLCCA